MPSCWAGSTCQTQQCLGLAHCQTQHVYARVFRVGACQLSMLESLEKLYFIFWCFPGSDMKIYTKIYRLIKMQLREDSNSTKGNYSLTMIAYRNRCKRRIKLYNLPQNLASQEQILKMLKCREMTLRPQAKQCVERTLVGTVQHIIGILIQT
jgi:hypothetical protein